MISGGDFLNASGAGPQQDRPMSDTLGELHFEPIHGVALPWLVQQIRMQTVRRLQSPQILSMKEIKATAPSMHRFRRQFLGNMTWTEHRALVTGAGHQWCNLLKDKWSCTGWKYRKRLRDTRVFNQTFSLENLPSNTNIFVYGHSHLANLVTSLICQSRAITEVWKISSSSNVLEGNSLIAYLPATNVTLLMLSNEVNTWDRLENLPSIFHCLSLWQFIPHAIVLGRINRTARNDTAHRLTRFRQQYPLVNIVPMSSSCFAHRTCPARVCMKGRDALHQ